MAAKRLQPVHPGDILRNDFLEPLGLTAYRLAKELGVSRPTVTQLVARRRNVTAEMALRLARYFWDQRTSLAEPAGAIRSGDRHHEDRQDRESEDSIAFRGGIF
jgi:addiction module HigA family antidote